MQRAWLWKSFHSCFIQEIQFFFLSLFFRQEKSFGCVNPSLQNEIDLLNQFKLVQTCPYLSKLVQTCPELSKLVQNCPNMSRELSKLVQTCPNLSKNGANFAVTLASISICSIFQLKVYTNKRSLWMYFELSTTTAVHLAHLW